jgi:hypothetical protein
LPNEAIPIEPLFQEQPLALEKSEAAKLVLRLFVTVNVQLHGKDGENVLHWAKTTSFFEF